MSKFEGRALRVNERLCFSDALSSMRIEAKIGRSLCRQARGEAGGQVP
jgi:hypothetical protein